MADTSPVLKEKDQGPRLFACVLCQARKVKCDRKRPCGNCVKANVKCTSRTPVPPRKRQPQSHDLQQRLAKCEELLSRYAQEAVPKAAAKTDGEPPWKAMGQLVIEDNGESKFTDSVIWATVHEELAAMRQIVDQEEPDDEPSPYTDASSPEDEAGLVMADGTHEDLDDYHPDAAQAVRLWQIFLDRVNPLTKIIHVPTVQPMLIDAATNPSQLPQNVEALLFSIYLMASVTMTTEECEAKLGSSKREVVSRFSKAARFSLIRIGMLKTYDLMVLQAVVFYMISLCCRHEHHSAWVLNGLVIRNAQKMGLHRDGSHLGLSPFEAEIRRRVWAQIIAIDFNTSMMSGFGRNVFPQLWDTKRPTNISDASMQPTMTAMEDFAGPTDCIFILCNAEMNRLFSDAPRMDLLLSKSSGQAVKDEILAKATKHLATVETTIKALATQFGDATSSPLHAFTINMLTTMLEKMKEFYPGGNNPKNTPWAKEGFVFKDYLFTMSTFMSERSLALYEASLPSRNYFWLANMRFNVTVLIYLAGQLVLRPTGDMTDRAWAVLELMYTYNAELSDLSYKPHATLASYVRRAWTMRQRVLHARVGYPPSTPAFIGTLEALATPGLSHKDSSAKSLSPTTVPLAGGGGSSGTSFSEMGVLPDSGGMMSGSGEVGMAAGFGAGGGTNYMAGGLPGVDIGSDLNIKAAAAGMAGTGAAAAQMPGVEVPGTGTTNAMPQAGFDQMLDFFDPRSANWDMFLSGADPAGEDLLNWIPDGNTNFM